IQSCAKHFLIQHQKSLPAQEFLLLPLFEFTSYSSCHLFSLNHVLPCAIYLRPVFSFFIYWLYFSSPSIISSSVTPFFNALLYLAHVFFLPSFLVYSFHITSNLSDVD